MMRKAAGLGCVLLAILISSTASGQSRQLHWEELAVTAHLDAEGRLHVDEKQVMVFTGDWNGGERTFNLRPRQELELEGMGRIDPATGAEIPLSAGSTSFVDSYELQNRNVLRWRSRETSDPPFDNTTITYVLHYTLSNILVKQGDGFLLDHDFAFTDRAGPIEQFSLELTLDPAWRQTGSESLTRSAKLLPSGTGYVVTIPLAYEGSGEVAVNPGAPPIFKAMLGSIVLLPALFLGIVLLRENSLGRFARVRPEAIDRQWIESNLLPLRAELVGTLWDQSVGSDEVSAVIARLVAEGKLRSRVSGDSMELDLLVPRSKFEGYELELIDQLFFDGDRTSTDAVRAHYKETGFDPATIISNDLNALAAQRLPPAKGTDVVGWLSCLSFLAAAGILIYFAVKEPDSRPVAAITGIGSFVLLIISAIATSSWGKRMDRGLISALLSLIPAGIAGGIAAWLLRTEGGPWGLSERMLLAISLMALWIILGAISSLRSKGTRESIEARKMLTAAREYFKRELKNERPALDDKWFPYLLAFGLSRDVEKWSMSFPSAASTMSTFPSSSSSSGYSGSSSSTSSWSGGGGSFGGAGASGAWAAAAGGMSAGVASASSSSDGSSGGGGGGSSGGGGGGGW